MQDSTYRLAFDSCWFTALSLFDSGSMSCFLFCFSFFLSGCATSGVHSISWTFCFSSRWPIHFPSWVIFTIGCHWIGVLQSLPICPPICPCVLVSLCLEGLLLLILFAVTACYSSISGTRLIEMDSTCRAASTPRWTSGSRSTSPSPFPAGFFKW